MINLNDAYEKISFSDESDELREEIAKIRRELHGKIWIDEVLSREFLYLDALCVYPENHDRKLHLQGVLSEGNANILEEINNEIRMIDRALQELDVFDINVYQRKNDLAQEFYNYNVLLHRIRDEIEKC